MTRSRLVLFAATVALLALPTSALAKPPTPSAPAPSGPSRLGFCGGDDWEPEMAHAGSRVYVVITHYPGDTTCDPADGAPNTIDLQVSTDGGRTFGSPAPVWTAPVGGVTYTAQADPTVAVDAAGAVYVAFLGYGVNGGHTDVIVAKSTNGGASFASAAKANAKDCKNCDHEKLIATSGGLYLAYSQATNHFIARSGDGGATWTQADVLTGVGNVAFAEAMVQDAAGNVFTAWGDCASSNCTGSPAASYRVSKTLAGTLTTTFSPIIGQSVQGPDCPFSSCGFSFFGPQDDLAIDAAGTLYLAWQAGQSNTTRKSPPVIELSKSTDGGSTWSLVGRVDDKTASGCAASACYALFPQLVGGAAGTLYAAWMDDRNGSPIDHVNGWNVWLRSSTTGGSSWTGPSVRESAYDPTQAQSQPNGFEFPYGDYFGLELNACGAPHLTWGEGIDYAGGAAAPGHIEYRTLC
jgi:hypothetical protein